MTNQAPEDYTDEDVRRRIKTGIDVVVIQPERNTTVPVEVEVHDADPGVRPGRLGPYCRGRVCTRLPASCRFTMYWGAGCRVRG